MGVYKIKKIGRDTVYGIWEIKETKPYFLENTVLDDDLQDTLRKAKNERKKLECLASRQILQKLVEEIGESYHGISKDKYGKPFLQNSSTHVSLTHSYPYVAAMARKSSPVGIDLEQVNEKIKRIEHKFLNEQEIFDANHNVSKLILLWSAKESVYKYYGRHNLIFRENIEIKPFELLQQGSLSAHVKLNGEILSHEIEYSQFENFMLTYMH